METDAGFVTLDTDLMVIYIEP